MNIGELEHNFERFLKKSLVTFRNVAFENNISESQFVILCILNEHGPKKISELAEYMQLTLSAITSLSEKLIGSGYIIRKRSQNDRRIVRLVLTDEGKSFSNELLSQRTKMVQKLHDSLTPIERKSLNSIYKKLI
ncbi:MarR family transcriptional regulator [Bacillus mexicanus]|uniref:MarR family transcriptional regulator n=1 Tax=Bacillus mexicanus TaxID=2834415 RepID=UPI003D196BAD